MLRFCIDFGTIFHDFRIILASFSITFSASILVSIFASIWERFWLQNGSQNGPSGRLFRPKRRQKSTTPNGCAPPGADLAAFWRQKRHKTTPNQILMDFYYQIYGCLRCMLTTFIFFHFLI